MKPSVVKESPLDDYFPPVIIDAESSCNCASPSPYCLVSMIANAADKVVSIASEQETDSPAVSSEEECSTGEEVEDVDAKEYFTDTFAVKGSFWEGRYQESLIKCMERKAKGEIVGVRACFETDNLRDKNAIKFEVLYFNAWHVIGYCSVEKIPKLMCKMGLTDLTTPTVCGICTFAVFLSVSRPFFCRFTVVYEGHFVLCCKKKLEPLDRAMPNLRGPRSA